MMKFLLIFIGLIILSSCRSTEGEYVCAPCDLPCDQLTFENPGICPHCNMKLIKKSKLIAESNLIPNEVNLKKGSGVFLFDNFLESENKSVKVYYHKPQNFTTTSKILMVIPGAGRNGDAYRDAWIEHSEKYNVLILSPMFEEEKYPFAAYHLCGLISDLNFDQSFKYIDGTNQVQLNDDIFSFKINTDKDKWIFGQLDQIFELVVDSENLQQQKYDAFGHSAGGQILHRMALLYGNLKVDKFIAANSGFYTLPDLETNLPFGTKGLKRDSAEMAESFSNNLTIMVGQLDNESETRGTLLRSSIVDKQGTHRLARAKYFYNFGKEKAAALEVDFHWSLEIIPEIGHDQKFISTAAAKLLYE